MQATVVKLEEHRRAERYPASSDAEVEAVGDDVYPAVLMDVSERGFRVMVDGHLQSQSLIHLKVGGLAALKARVVWVNGTVLGCEFAESISSASVADMLRRRISEQRCGIELYLDEDAG
jgi:hypothetical protein